MPSTHPQMWPDRLWLVRAGQSSGNVARGAAEAGRLPLIDIQTRDADTPLSEVGQEQSAALGHWFARMAPERRPEHILVSPYVRARQTARAIAVALKLPTQAPTMLVDERLREKEFGILDRYTVHGIRSRFPELDELRRRVGKFYFRPPGGESWCDVILRLRGMTDMTTREYAGRRVLVVAHQVIVSCFPTCSSISTKPACSRSIGRPTCPIATSRRFTTTPRSDHGAGCAWSRPTPSRRWRDPRCRSPQNPMHRRARADAEVAPRPRPLTPKRLHEHALPSLDQNGSKEDRGRVLVIGGTRSTSGAMVLAGLAALGAGAGKVQVATSRSAFPLVAPLLPEALLIELPEDRHGGLSGHGLRVLQGMAERADAVCIGPGLTDAKAARRVLQAFAPIASHAT